MEEKNTELEERALQRNGLADCSDMIVERVGLRPDEVSLGATGREDRRADPRARTGVRAGVRTGTFLIGGQILFGIGVGLGLGAGQG